MVAIAFVLAICALMLMAVMSVQIRDAEREQADASPWIVWEFEDMRERAVKDCMQIDD